METKIKILHLEDNPTDVKLVKSALERANVRFELFLADTEKDYHHHLKNENIDIILSDYNLPGYSGMGALLFAKNHYPNVPFIFLSGIMGEDTAIESLLNGATDYVLKNKMERLVPAINRAYKESQEQLARRKAEQACRESEENYHYSISESPLGIRIVSVGGKTIYANQSFLDIYGLNSLEEFTNTDIVNLYTPESYKQHIERKKRRNNGIDMCEYEISIVNKISGVRYIKVSCKEVRWNGAKHYQVINQDITEQKKLTWELIKAKEKAEESDRLKTAFLHNISHEIRTPLNAIVGFSDFINEPELTHDMRKKFTEIIVHNSNHLLSIISAIINIASIEAGQEHYNESEINLNSMLKRLQTQFQVDAKKQNIILNLIPNIPYEERIASDETKLVQILSNLISNALKFTKQGHVNFGYIVRENELEFFVEDTGIGIPPIMHDEIFKRFRQVESTIARQYRGSGLGLSISKAYVEIIGGKMWYVSELHKGSTFYFTIPYLRAKKNTLSEKQKQLIKGSPIQINEPKTVLVAEDENDNFMLMEALMLNLNINIVRAMTGVEAIEACRSKHVDVVLMDIKMPVMDGYEATKQIRKFLPDIPIIAQTAYATAIDKSKAMACGCTDFISKPFRKGLLVSKVKEQLYKL
jgi:PAS domain S-box-containing protein